MHFCENKETLQLAPATVVLGSEGEEKGGLGRGCWMGWFVGVFLVDLFIIFYQQFCRKFRNCMFGLKTSIIWA